MQIMNDIVSGAVRSGIPFITTFERTLGAIECNFLCVNAIHMVFGAANLRAICNTVLVRRRTSVYHIEMRAQPLLSVKCVFAQITAILSASAMHVCHVTTVVRFVKEFLAANAATESLCSCVNGIYVFS